MSTRFTIRLTTLVVSLAVALGTAPRVFAQTTNGNGGTTDVGVYYDNILAWTSPTSSQWERYGLNYLPLVQLSSGAPYEYQQYDAINTQVIADDMAILAAAKVDFIIIDLSNDTAANVAGGCSSTDWIVVRACYVATGVANWNASNPWKIRYALMAGGLAVGDTNSEVAGDLYNYAPAVYTDWVTNSTYGGAANYYQINGKYVMFNIGNAGGTCTGTCTDTNMFFWTSQSGNGCWGWNTNGICPNSLSTEIAPGWDNYQWGIGHWWPRNDGNTYDSAWNYIFNNPYPRIVWIEGYNDWAENGGIGAADTATITNPPIGVDNSQDACCSPAGRYPESWTMPDQNITLAGYWNYTVAAICYVRNGNSSTECSSTASPKPTLPQPSINLAVNATATASSTNTPGWQTYYVNDGNPGTGWSSAGQTSATTPDWIQLHWPTKQTFNTVVLMGRTDTANWFPVSFQIQSSPDGITWTPLVTEINFPQETIPGQPIEFTFGTTTASYVRLNITQSDLYSGDGKYYSQLGEFEVFNNGSIETSPVLLNWGFEAPYQGFTSPYYQQAPSGANWTFGGTSGVQENGSGFHSPQAPQGMQTGYLTGSSSTISQAITLPAGSYTLRFLASETDGLSQSVDVSFNGTPIGSFGSFPSTGFTPYVTNPFTSTGSSQTITFAGAGSGTALIDEVQIFAQSPNLLSNFTWSTGDLTGWLVWVGSGSNSSEVFAQPGPLVSTVNGDPYRLTMYAASGTMNVAAYQVVTGQPSSQHFTASVYAITAAGTSGAQLIVTDNSTTTLCTASLPANTSSWTKFSCSGTVPSTGTIQFKLYSGNQSNAQNYTVWDNASLTVQ